MDQEYVEVDIWPLAANLAEDAWSCETGKIPKEHLYEADGITIQEYWASQFLLLLQRYKELIMTYKKPE